MPPQNYTQLDPSTLAELAIQARANAGMKQPGLMDMPLSTVTGNPLHTMTLSDLTKANQPPLMMRAQAPAPLPPQEQALSQDPGVKAFRYLRDAVGQPVAEWLRQQGPKLIPKGEPQQPAGTTSDQLRSMQSQRPPFDVTNMGKAEGLRAMRPWELFNGERSDAVIVDPKSPVATMARVAFPRMYGRLAESPIPWDLQFMRNASPDPAFAYMSNKMPNAGAAAALNPLTQQGWIGVRPRTFDVLMGKQPMKYMGDESSLGHELNHALRYDNQMRYGEPMSPDSGMPAQGTSPERLKKMTDTVISAQPELYRFGQSYVKPGKPETLRTGQQEILTEAAGRSSTKYAARTGKFEEARQAVRDLINKHWNEQ